MDAYVATVNYKGEYYESEGTCDYYLPRVKCDVCTVAWADSEVWYPTTSLALGADKQKFSREISVPVGQFDELRAQVVCKNNEGLRLLPGGGIGVVRSKVPLSAPDFIWCCFKLLARRRAIEILAEHAVSVPFGPALVQVGRQTSEDYVALQLDPVPLFAESTLNALTLVFCHRCGSCEMQNKRWKGKIQHELVGNRLPKSTGLVRVYEAPATLATPEFMEVIRSRGLTGIDFKKWGVFV